MPKYYWMQDGRNRLRITNLDQDRLATRLSVNYISEGVLTDRNRRLG